MKVYDKLFINGDWVTPAGKGSIDVINAATEEEMASVPEGSAEDIDRAVKAAARRVRGWSAQTARGARGVPAEDLGGPAGARRRAGEHRWRKKSACRSRSARRSRPAFRR